MLQTASKTYLAQTRFLFHAHIKIKIPQYFGESLLEECFALLTQIDRTYNSFQAGSYFYRINRYPSRWIAVDDAMCYLMEIINFVSECTNGAYDITCMPLLRLWGFHEKQHNGIPKPDAIAHTLRQVDYRAVEMKDRQIRCLPKMELTSGSFIKSFAVDRVIELLKTRGVTDAVVNAGGSTIYGINDEGHKQWTIHIPVPSSPLLSRESAIKDECFSLSARAHNVMEVDGKRYGHILNCLSGHPADTLQAGVWCKEAFLADVISTALFVVEDRHVEETAERLRSRFNFDYFRIAASGKLMTGGCSRYPL